MNKNMISRIPWGKLVARRGLIAGLLIIASLIAFEVFNYASTEWFLHETFGDFKAMGIRWSIILALALWGVDFAGIARLLSTPMSDPEVPSLLGATILCSLFNVATTWFAMSLKVSGRQQSPTDMIIALEVMKTIVPIFVAAIVALVRVMIIASFIKAGGRLFTTGQKGE